MTLQRLTELLEVLKGDDVEAKKKARLEIKRAMANANRRARELTYKDLGLKKVKGNLGGTYYE